MRNLCENVWGIRRGRLGIRIGWDCGGMGKYWLGVHKLSRELIEEFAKNIFAN